MSFEAELDKAYPIPQVSDSRTGYVYPLLWGKVTHFIMQPNITTMQVNFECYAQPDCNGDPVTQVGITVELEDGRTDELMKDAWTRAMAGIQQAMHAAAQEAVANGEIDAPEVVAEQVDEDADQ